ncbi:Uu.00g053220.m01.CDS01 [Anthostomella pinea]|uniref:Uu.00g053220.m01.CDS01 n=1 Tax=Anthostomella pinea TaxID=933095 RepID=A0AAI8VWC1_9PEZI|nr:Uu.00g053220.m01.CDS01 [Anthostomella pinea]
MMLLGNLIFPVGFLAASAASAAIDTNTASPNTARQAGLQLPVQGHWVMGANEDQCDGTGDYDQLSVKARVEDCQWIRDYLLKNHGYYEASDWASGGQTAVVAYKTCEFSATVIIGGQNVADLIDYVTDPKHGIASGDYVGAWGGMKCYASPDNPVPINWAVHQTNGAPFDDFTVQVPALDLSDTEVNE